jgi:hypothetical protein
MSIFSRRRLQAMLDELDPLLTPQKTNELLGRLEHERTSQAIGAEYELALSWAVSRVFATELEPDFSARPDMLVQGFLDKPAVIEVTAVSDSGFAQEDDMRRAANILANAASRLKKGSGEHLYFHFAERRVVQKGKSYRQRCVTKDFALSDRLEQSLKQWLYGTEPAPTTKLQLIDLDGAINITVEWKSYVPRLFNFFSSMPAVGQDLEGNVIFKAILSLTDPPQRLEVRTRLPRPYRRTRPQSFLEAPVYPAHRHPTASLRGGISGTLGKPLRPNRHF